jgi:hypothetical protein
MLRHVALLLVLAYPGSAPPQGEETRSAIQVKVHLPARAAFEQASAAFLRESLTVASANAYAGSLTSSPVQRGTGVVRLSLVYRAAISPAGDSAAIIVLSGTYSLRDAAGNLTVDERPITSKPPPQGLGQRAKDWGPIERMAAWLTEHYGEAGASR